MVILAGAVWKTKDIFAVVEVGYVVEAIFTAATLGVVVGGVVGGVVGVDGGVGVGVGWGGISMLPTYGP